MHVFFPISSIILVYACIKIQDLQSRIESSLYHCIIARRKIWDASCDDAPNLKLLSEEKRVAWVADAVLKSHNVADMENFVLFFFLALNGVRQWYIEKWGCLVS
jgi:hypothetical protein